MMIGEKEVRLISIKGPASEGTIADLCRELESSRSDCAEITLDFRGVKEVCPADAEILMSTCLRLKDMGAVIRLKGMSLPVRDQFLLSAINNARDEIVL